MGAETVKKGQFLIVRGDEAIGLTARGRIMQSPIDQIVQFRAPNKYYGLRLEHIRGPLKGVTVHFTCAAARKAKIRDVCVCSAYLFPHKKGQGKCKKSI